jgi:hypothetical protein
MSRLKQHKPPKPSRQQSAVNNSKAQGAVPSWLPHLTQYKDKRILTFRSEKDLDLAIDLLWSDELRHLPHETPDGNSLVIPAEAVDYFRRTGLRFTDKKLRCVTELPPEEIGRLRR